MKIKETEKGLILNVYVKPRSKKFGIRVEEDEVVVNCLEEPVEGKVNKELVKKLSGFSARR